MTSTLSAITDVTNTTDLVRDILQQGGVHQLVAGRILESLDRIDAGLGSILLNLSECSPTQAVSTPEPAPVAPVQTIQNPTVETKYCSYCKNELPLSNFTKSSKSPDGLDYYCRDCKSILAREWAATQHAKALRHRIHISPSYKNKDRERRQDPNRKAAESRRNKIKYLLRKAGETFPKTCDRCGAREKLCVHILPGDPTNIEYKLLCRCCARRVSMSERCAS